MAGGPSRRGRITRNTLILQESPAILRRRPA
jgi:hypothetical protein